MCLEVGKQKAKNDQFIWVLKCSKNVRVWSLLEAEINNATIG